MRAWGRLVRLSLAPSAIADIACGIVLGAGRWPAAGWPFVLILASLCVYHGGMALNDWSDRAEDARLRPDRPIPSGAVRPAAALAVAVLLLFLGPLLAWTLPGADTAALASRPVTLIALAAAAAVVYDLVGRGPWLGPALLAVCRSANLGAGIAAGRLALGGDGSGFHPALWSVPCLYAGYVFVVSRLGRLEDVEGEHDLGRMPAVWIAAAAALLLAVPIPAALARPLAALPSFAVAAAGAYGLARLALRREPWTKPDVLRSMGMALRRLIVFTAAAALLAPAPDGWIVAALILCGFPLSFALRRVFPPS